MKKLFVLFILVFTFSLTACSAIPFLSKETTEETEESTKKKTKKTKKTTKESTEESTEDDTEESTEEETSKGKSSNSKSTLTDVSVKEEEIFNQEGFVVHSVSIENTELMGAQLKLLIENNSDTKYDFSAKDVSVNGFSMDANFYEAVPAGKKTSAKLIFNQEMLALCGIETITDIEFSLSVSDVDTYETLFVSSPITVKTDAAGTYEQKYDDSGNLVFNDKGLKIVQKDLTYDEYFGLTCSFYIENTTDKPLLIVSEDTIINGLVEDGFLSATVTPGKRTITGLHFYSTDITSASEVEELEISFSVMDAETWGSLFEIPTVTLNP